MEANVRTRTLQRKMQKSTIKALEKRIKEIKKEFENRKELLEALGLSATLLNVIENFEKSEYFGIAGKNTTARTIRACYTKAKNNIKKLIEEIEKREDEIKKIVLIQEYVGTLTKIKITNKFNELRKIEQEQMKKSNEVFLRAEDAGIPEEYLQYFNDVEMMMLCLKDIQDSVIFTEIEKKYMKQATGNLKHYIKYIDSTLSY